MRDSAAFDFDVGLITPRTAPKKTRSFIFRTVELEPDDELPVSVARGARISPVASCHQGDVVLVRDQDDKEAGRVKLHCNVAGIQLSFIAPIQAPFPKGRHFTSSVACRC